MKICDLNKNKNNDYIVLLPKYDYDIKASVEYTFKNVIYLDYNLTKNDAELLIDFINNNLEQLVLFDHDDFYRQILPYIRKQKKVKWIFKHNFASLTEGCVRTTFSSIMEFYDRNIVNKIGCLDLSTYEVLKNAGYRVEYIKLDIKESIKEKNDSNSIGLIGNDYNPNHNIYNQLTAIKMVDYDFIKIIRTMPATEHFINFFDIKEKKVDTIDEVISDNFVNLYCNFTFTNYELVLKSMDKGIPCLLGNTDIFDKYPKLKKYIVLNSDDDVNEIAEKIKEIKKNIKTIMKEYNTFRNDYHKESIKSINQFLK